MDVVSGWRRSHCTNWSKNSPSSLPMSEWPLLKTSLFLESGTTFSAALSHARSAGSHWPLSLYHNVLSLLLLPFRHAHLFLPYWALHNPENMLVLVCYCIL